MIKMHEILGLSIVRPNNIKVGNAIEEELEKRLSRYNKGETKFYSWSEIKNELNASLSTPTKIQ